MRMNHNPILSFFSRHGRQVLTVLAVMTVMSGTAQPKDYIELSDAERQLVASNTKFAFRLIRQASEGQTDESMLLSPLSITYALGILNNVATGETQQQICEVLGGDGVSVDVINGFCRKMLAESVTIDKETKVMIANNLYVNSARGFVLKPLFVEKALTYYDATPETRDFHDGLTRDVINQWASDHTEGMIKEVLKEDEFDSEVISYLLNALYFKGVWMLPFDEAQTEERPFGTNRTAYMMMQTAEDLYYAKNDFCQSVILPYGNGAYEMVVFLPGMDKSVDDVIEGLCNSGLATLDYDSYEVLLGLPRFKTSTDVRLENIMSQLGMPLAFTPMAEFTEFCGNEMDPNHRVFISLMKQVAKIDVNEEGSEASAVTVIGMKDYAVMPEQRVEFIADRPFVYVIRERSTGAIFFIGLYTGEPAIAGIDDTQMTGREDEKAVVPAEAIYNLSGQRMRTIPSHGVFVQGGKKIRR